MWPPGLQEGIMNGKLICRPAFKLASSSGLPQWWAARSFPPDPWTIKPRWSVEASVVFGVHRRGHVGGWRSQGLTPIFRRMDSCSRTSGSIAGWQVPNASIRDLLAPKKSDPPTPMAGWGRSSTSESEVSPHMRTESWSIFVRRRKCAFNKRCDSRQNESKLNWNSGTETMIKLGIVDQMRSLYPEGRNSRSIAPADRHPVTAPWGVPSMPAEKMWLRLIAQQLIRCNATGYLVSKMFVFSPFFGWWSSQWLAPFSGWWPNH